MTFEIFWSIRCAPARLMLVVPPPAGDLSRLKSELTLHAKEIESKARNCFHDEGR